MFLFVTLSCLNDASNMSDKIFEKLDISYVRIIRGSFDMSFTCI